MFNVQLDDSYLVHYLVARQHCPPNMYKGYVPFNFAALQVFFAQQNYNVTEDETVDIILETSTSDYEFDFTVTLQHMNGTAAGEALYFSTQNRPFYRYLHSIRF